MNETGASTPNQRLSVERVLDVALAIIDADGLDRLSMRHLGACLGVDPMAVYHHVANKQAIIAAVVRRVLEAMPQPTPTAPWDQRVRSWAGALRALVLAHPALAHRIIVDPAAAGSSAAQEATRSLHQAITDSGVAADDVAPCADLVVDFVNGATLAAASPAMGPDDRPRADRSFAIGLEIIIGGLRSRAQ